MFATVLADLCRRGEHLFDTIIEVAEMMARLRRPLVAVVKDNKLHGVITASRLLAAALKH